jgi:hypothetical protein
MLIGICLGPFTHQEEIINNLQIVERGLGILVSIGPALLVADRLENGFCSFWVIPEIGLVGEFLFLKYEG